MFTGEFSVAYILMAARRLTKASGAASAHREDNFEVNIHNTDVSQGCPPLAGVLKRWAYVSAGRNATIFCMNTVSPSEGALSSDWRTSIGQAVLVSFDNNCVLRRQVNSSASVAVPDFRVAVSMGPDLLHVAYEPVLSGITQRSIVDPSSFVTVAAETAPVLSLEL